MKNLECVVAVLELCHKGRKATIAKEKANADAQHIENVLLQCVLDSHVGIEK